MDKDLERIMVLFDTLMAGRFYGELTFKLESGNVVHVIKKESIKLGN